MAVFHYVHLRAFAHETEDPQKVAHALREAARGEVEIKETYAEGGHGNRIIIMEADARGTAAEKRLFGQLLQDDPQGFDEVARTLRGRLDENLNFHLRLDKQEAYRGRVALATGDDAITVRAKIRSFESKRTGFPLEASLQQLEAFVLGVQAPRGSAVGE